MVLLFSYSEWIFCEVRAVEKQGFLEGEPNYWSYYYLCDFIKELNAANGTTFYINDSKHLI